MTGDGTTSRYGCTCGANNWLARCPTHGIKDRLALLDVEHDEPEAPFARPKFWEHGDMTDYMAALEQQVAALRAQVDEYLNDPAQPMADLREELDLTAASRDAAYDEGFTAGAMGCEKVMAQRDGWIRSWNRLEAAISHHKKAKSDMFVDEVDEALYAARDRILKERAA